MQSMRREREKKNIEEMQKGQESTTTTIRGCRASSPFGGVGGEWVGQGRQQGVLCHFYPGRAYSQARVYCMVCVIVTVIIIIKC